MPKSWARLACFLIFGYLSMGRSFGYLGIPAAGLFIGEISLGAFVLIGSRYWLEFLRSMLTRRSRVNNVLWAGTLFLVYGVSLTVRGILLGRSPITCAESFVFNYYPLFLLFGLALGVNQAIRVDRLALLLAWVTGLYGLLYSVVLNHFQDMTIPGSNVPVFGQTSAGLSILAIIVFETNLSRAWVPLLLNFTVFACIQVRGEWLGFFAALTLWTILERKFALVAKSVFPLVALAGLACARTLGRPPPAGRGGEASVRGVIGRAIAPLDPDLASQYVENADDFAGTVQWRQDWWKEIWNSVNETPETFVFGHAYGYDIASLVDYIESGSLRTPHNIFFYCLCYGGWLGVAFFAFFMYQIFRALWAAYHEYGEIFGLIVFVSSIVTGCFGDFFEAPYGAIPFYLIVGLSLAPLMREEFEIPATLMGRSRRSKPLDPESDDIPLPAGL